MKTCDREIRRQLHSNLSNKYGNDKSTVIIDELGLCQGDARIDVAVINGLIHGFEIKSERDTLDRLSNQINIYSRVLDTVTVLTGPSHLEELLDITPDWWGVNAVTKEHDGNISFQSIRKTKNNPNIDSYSLVQLLWRDEALNLLIELNLEKGYLSKSRIEIWKRLSDFVPLIQLQSYVRQILKERENWRSD